MIVPFFSHRTVVFTGTSTPSLIEIEQTRSMKVPVYSSALVGLVETVISGGGTVNSKEIMHHTRVED